MTESEYNKALKELDVVLLDVDYEKFNSVVDVAKFVIQLNKINENILAKETEQIKKEYKQTEKEYAELKIKNHDYAIWATDKIAELEKENAELKKENDFNIVSVSDGGYCGICQRCKRTFIGDKRQLYCRYCEQITKLEKENAELKAQIEKMKCYFNNLNKWE